MINEGISELLFTSDGIKQMEASYYPELLGCKKENMNYQKSKKLWINFTLQKVSSKFLLFCSFKNAIAAIWTIVNYQPL